MKTDKILIVPSGKAGDIIIQAYKDAGYKIKKPKPVKIKFKATNGILNEINKNYYIEETQSDKQAVKQISKYVSNNITRQFKKIFLNQTNNTIHQREKVEQDGDDERRNVVK